MRMVKSLVVVLFGLLAATASAQTVQNPREVEFKVSPDHGAVKVDGTTPLVTRYELRATGMNNNGAVALTVDLGKPTPTAADGLVTVPVSQFAAALSPNLLYTLIIVAVGPDGEAASDVSNPFARVTPQVPRAPTGVRVR